MDNVCHSGEGRNPDRKNGLDPFLITFVILTVIGSILCGLSYASEKPQPKGRYKIIKPVYVYATYNSLNNRKLDRETARAYLHAAHYYNKAEVAFQCEVPAGTIMTIIGPTPKVWYGSFFADRYFIKLDPDLSRGLDIVLILDRGIEGDLDGLNPKLFSRQEKQVGQPLTRDKETMGNENGKKKTAPIK